VPISSFVLIESSDLFTVSSILPLPIATAALTTLSSGSLTRFLSITAPKITLTAIAAIEIIPIKIILLNILFSITVISLPE